MAKKFRLRVNSLIVNQQQEWGKDTVRVRLFVDGANGAAKQETAEVAKGTRYFYSGFAVTFEKVVKISVHELDPLWDDGIGTTDVFPAQFGEKWIPFERTIKGDGASYTLKMVLEEIPESTGDLGKFRLGGGFTQLNNLDAFLTAMSPTNGWGYILCIMLFMLMYNAYKERLQKPAAPPTGGAKLPARAVWLWNKPSDGQPVKKFLVSSVLDKPQEYLTWAKTHNINQSWIDVSIAVGNPDVKPTQAQLQAADKLGKFCELATSQGMTVYFLCLNDPVFALKQFHGSAKKYLTAVFALIGTINPVARPTGINVDCEPHLLDNWEKETETVGGEFIELLHMLKMVRDEQVAVLDQYVNLCVTMTYWFMQPKSEFNKIGGKFVGRLALEAGFDAAVMDFRKTVDDAIEQGALWTQAARETGQLAWLGFEANPVLDTWNYSGKPGEIDPDLSTLTSNFLADSGFATAAVQDANGYFALIG